MKSSLEIDPAERIATAPPESARNGRAVTGSPGVIQILDPLANPNWDAQVMGLAGATVFHSSAWARVLKESYGYKPLYFAKVENSNLRALLSVMEVDSWVTGKRGVSLPFSDACEPLGTCDTRDQHELFQKAIEYGRANGWKYFESRGAAMPDSNTPVSESFFDHSLALSRDDEKVFAGFESSVRRAIRKAEKSGPTIEISRSLEGMQIFYSLHCQTRKKHGVPPQPFSFFETFHRNVIARDLGFVVIARFEGKPIAASVFVHFGSTAIYKYGASDETLQHLRGANLVMWHAIQWCAQAGFEQFNFGRTDKGNEGLRRFKLGWGAKERSLQYFKYDLRANRFVMGKGESSKLREQVIKRIPIPIARMIGSVLYRHVA